VRNQQNSDSAGYEFCLAAEFLSAGRDSVGQAGVRGCAREGKVASGERAKKGKRPGGAFW
jgi:hypothetical protein